MERQNGSKDYLRTSKENPNTSWTLEVMAGAIYALKDAGEPVNSAYLHSNHPRLASRITNYPGGWKKVVQEAGFDPQLEQRRSRNKK